MKLSVVILNYNVHYFLELCLKSVQRAVDNIDAEIIVIDNNSKDGSCKMVKNNFPNISLIENTENVGFAKANNQAVNVANGDYVCILNPDTVVSEDTFHNLLSFVETKENLGIVGCQLIDGTGCFLPESKRNVPDVKAAAQKLLGNSKYYYAKHIAKDNVGDVEILVGAFMFLKRSVYNKIKGFDEDYFMYGEDIDISYKSLKEGHNNYYYGNTKIIHYKGESTLKDKKYAKRFYGAMQIFYKKHFKKNVIFDLFVWLGLKLAYFIRKEPKFKEKEVNQYVFVSNKLNQDLEKALTQKMVLVNHVEDIPNNAEIIFDANYLTYKDIIEQISKTDNKDNTYKILPHGSNFILGSNNSKSRGEVITF